MRRPGLLLALLATLLLSAAGSALADHDLSHTYHFEGRVVDAEGTPVPNASVTVRLESGFVDPRTGDPVLTRKTYVTDCAGRILPPYPAPAALLHVHEMSATARLSADVLGERHPLAVDPLLRASAALIRLNQTVADEPCAEANATYRVFGRLGDRVPYYYRESVGIHVSPFADLPLHVTLTYNDGLRVEAGARTDGNGTYAIDLPLDEPLRTGTVTLDWMNTTETLDADPVAGFVQLPSTGRATRVPLDGIEAPLRVEVLALEWSEPPVLRVRVLERSNATIPAATTLFPGAGEASLLVPPERVPLAAALRTGEEVVLVAGLSGTTWDHHLELTGTPEGHAAEAGYRAETPAPGVVGALAVALTLAGLRRARGPRGPRTRGRGS